MPLRQLKSIYEKRKNTLIDLLKKDSKIDKSRKDQLVGAISEIDTLLKTIENLREQEIEDNKRLDVMTLDTKKLNLLNIPMFKKINDKIKIRFDQSKTRENLTQMFIRKCEAKTKYEFYSSLAKKEGYEHLSHVFLEFAQQETEHAKIIFRYLGLEKPTPENIKDAAKMERFYDDKLYSDFEDKAKEEKFDEIAEFLKELAEIDAEQEKTLLKFLRMFHEKRLFRSDQSVRWKCKNCGYIIESREAPKKCKVCKKNQGYFSIVNEN